MSSIKFNHRSTFFEEMYNFIDTIDESIDCVTIFGRGTDEIEFRIFGYQKGSIFLYYNDLEKINYRNDYDLIYSLFKFYCKTPKK